MRHYYAVEPGVEWMVPYARQRLSGGSVAGGRHGGARVPEPVCLELEDDEDDLFLELLKNEISGRGLVLAY